MEEEQDSLKRKEEEARRALQVPLIKAFKS